MKDIFDSIARRTTSTTPAAPPAPKPEPDPDATLDAQGKPVDLPKALRNFAYYKENREQVLAERNRLREKARLEAEAKRDAEAREARMMSMARKAAEKEITVAELQLQEDARIKAEEDRDAAIEKRAQEIRDAGGPFAVES